MIKCKVKTLQYIYKENNASLFSTPNSSTTSCSSLNNSSDYNRNSTSNNPSPQQQYPFFTSPIRLFLF